MHLLVRFNRIAIALSFFAFLAAVSSAAQDVPVFTIDTANSSVTFYVKASVALKGTFEKWNSTLTFTSDQATSGALDIEIQADSVNTGSGMKDGKLKSKDFFDVKTDPTISFKSNKVIQTSPNTFELDGDFTIRGQTKPEKLVLTVDGMGTGTGEIKGTMAFDRKDYGMNKGIPFVTIADRVEVSVDLKGKRTSGPALKSHM
jgi:polyisoprenoid-binding protein YceI